MPHEHKLAEERFAPLIRQRRSEYENDRDNWETVVALADALRVRDATILDGGKHQAECISLFNEGASLLRAERAETVRRGGDPRRLNVRVMTVLDSLSKVYFQANMFEKAAECCEEVLSLDGERSSALYYRGTVSSLLGRYEEAAADLSRVLLDIDDPSVATTALSGLSKILIADEDAVPGGWEGPILRKVRELEARGRALPPTAGAAVNSFLFSYHDRATGNRDAAFAHLAAAQEVRAAVLPPHDLDAEERRAAGVRSVFHRGFFADELTSSIGSASRAPVFVVGFVRSGSTLLERVLDAHPDVVGTGEDSVFNGRLDDIRNEIVRVVSGDGDGMSLSDTVRRLADDVVDGYRERWERIERTRPEEDRRTRRPRRFVDKMLTNYNNVGFIHMLFPNALILHVIREPMDSAFSAYRHEFPRGSFDHTNDFDSLAHIYRIYRDTIDHWDAVLPGRVAHVRYEDMVHDMPGVARAVVRAAGLRWDDGVLEFHRKKHAVNTLSSTQVRQGVYKHSIDYWKRYEKHLRPLAAALGDRVRCNVETTLPGYEPPSWE